MLLADDVVELHPRAAAVGAEPVVLAGFEVWQIWFSKCLKVLVFFRSETFEQSINEGGSLHVRSPR